MDKNIHGLARKIASGINTVELRGAAGIESSVKLMLDLIEARKALGREPTYALSTITQLALATHKFADGLKDVAACHQDLVTIRTENDPTTVGFGDVCPAEGSSPLRIVA